MTLYNLRKVAIEAAADAVLDHWAATGRIGPTLADRSTHSGDAIDVATVCIDRADRALSDLAGVDTEAARPHRYRSTACLHARHGDCRRQCKFCDAPCGCDCHKETPDA